MTQHPTHDITPGSHTSFFKQYLTWDILIKLFCAATASIMLIIIIGRSFFEWTFLKDISTEHVYIGLVIILLLPRLTKLGIGSASVELQEKVEHLSKTVVDHNETLKALPDYLLGAYYEQEKDNFLAEQKYRSSIAQSSDWWLARFSLATLLDERKDEYACVEALQQYQGVLSSDPSNVYALNNLASLYISGPKLIQDTDKALEMAQRALATYPTFGDALYYKAVALNRQGKWKEAKNILDDMNTNNRLPDAPRWPKYEELISDLNLGTCLSKSLDELLDDLWREWRDNRFLETLKEDKMRGLFPQEAIKTIDQFVKEDDKPK